MDLSVFLVVLFSALFQASWNLFAKNFSGNRSVLILVGWFFLGMAGLPWILVRGEYFHFGTTEVGYLAATVVGHSLYVALLGWAYSLGELSVVFPVSRGMGVALTAFLSEAMWGALPPLGAFAIFAVVVGAFLISRGSPSRAAVTRAIGIGFVVAAYSLVDSRGVRVISPLFMTWTNLFFCPLAVLPFFLRFFRRDLTAVLRNAKARALFVGGAGALGYLLVLWAFQHAPVSFVVALRECSICFAAILGVVYLNEAMDIKKTLGIALIVVGVVCLKFAGSGIT